MPRRLSLLVLAAAAATASAQPAPAPAVWAEPDPAVVVGRWRATITWRGCPAAGEARAVLEVARDGSGYALDLAPVLDGLGPTVLVPAAARRLESERDDLRVAWTTGKHNRATLVVKFSSGCTGTAALVRDATGAPACDELAALEAIAGRCDAATAPVVTDADRAAIAGARAARTRAAATRTCTRLATPLRATLIEGGCVPVRVDLTTPGVRIPECEALLVSVSRLVRCNKVPADAKQRLVANMQRVSRWATIDPAGRADENLENAKEVCVKSREEMDELLTLMGC